jgi:hypothetical protein
MSPQRALWHRNGNSEISMSDLTRILDQIEQGDPTAAEHLLPLVYDDLRQLATARLAHARSWLHWELHPES